MSEESESKALAINPHAGQRGIVIANMDEAGRFAQMVASSGLAPRGMDTAAKVMVAVQTGMELGLTPMRALQSVVVVNGRATLMGEAALALIRGCGQLHPGTDVEVGCKEIDGVLTGYCRSRRRDRPWQESFFTQDDAKKAGLWGKSGPWSSYPKRMLMWRAVAFHTRDFWSDVTHGLLLADEAVDVAFRTQEVLPETPEAGEVTGEADPLIVEAAVEDAMDEEEIEAIAEAEFGDNL